MRILLRFGCFDKYREEKHKSLPRWLLRGARERYGEIGLVVDWPA